MHGNSFLVCSACDEIGSTYAQHAIKSFFGYLSKKNLVPRMLMLSHRGNVWISKFWRKLMEKKRNFFAKIYEGHIRIWFREKKKSKLSHACVPLKHQLLNLSSRMPKAAEMRQCLVLRKRISVIICEFSVKPFRNMFNALHIWNRRTEQNITLYVGYSKYLRC
jgi:hypothetical protein